MPFGSTDTTRRVADLRPAALPERRAPGRFDYLTAAPVQAGRTSEPAPGPAPDVLEDDDDLIASIAAFVLADICDPAPLPGGGPGALPKGNRRSGALDLDALYTGATRDAWGGISVPESDAVGTAFARYHGLVTASAPPGGSEIRFGYARQHTRWLHQWLAVHDLLPQLCDPATLAATRLAAAPAYGAFLRRMGATGYGGKLPVPLELLALVPPRRARVASGDTAVTSLYDVTRDSRFAHPFRSTGAEALWRADSGPAFNMDGSFDARHAHRAAALAEGASAPAALPTARAAIAAFAELGIALPATPELDADMALAPYLAAESEAWWSGHLLGPLGSRILAETILGLVQHTPGSYWRAPGSVGARWHPRDAARPDGTVIDGFETLARVTGLI